MQEGGYSTGGDGDDRTGRKRPKKVWHFASPIEYYS
jgi:hypothetical protein